MRKMLIMLVLGASIALPATAAFAEGPENADRSNGYSAAGVAAPAAQAAPGEVGTLAGSGQLPAGPYVQQRLENFGR